MCGIGDIRVVVIPTVILDIDQSLGLHRCPPAVADPAPAEQGSPVHFGPCLRPGHDKTGGLQIRLRIDAELCLKVLENIQEAPLDAMAWKIQVEDVEIAAVIEGKADAVLDGRFATLFQQPVQQLAESDDALAHCLYRAQVTGQADMIILTVFIGEYVM